MITLWLCLLVLVLGLYVLLDGFDLGVGILHLLVAKDGPERHRFLASVAPLWDGNEVWLIAGGGTLFAIFPALFATGFSAFYLPLMILLWLLVMRALGIELQHQMSDPMWLRFWDYAFSAASVLIALILGAAIGNVVRGVPFSAEGECFLPLWTDFSLSGEVGVLDAYTLLTGVTAIVVLAQHGSAWLNLRLDGELREKVRGAQRRLWPLCVIFVLVTTVVTLRIQDRALENLGEHLWLWAFPVMSLAGLVTVRLRFVRSPALAFAGSCLLILGLLTSAVSSIWPYGLPSSNTNPGMLISDAAAQTSALTTMLWWWVPGMLLVIAYTAFIYSHLPSTEPKEH